MYPHGPQGQPQQRPPQYGPQYGTDPYPQQSYGPPYQPPPKQGLAWWVWALIAGAVVMVGVFVTVVIVQANESETVSTERVQMEAQSILDDNNAGTLTGLECPTMEVEKGAVYTCLGEIDGYTVKVVVTVQDDEGNMLLEIS